MSRLDDLIDLVQTTNEVYFITAPGRVRTAFILADDIVELALKTFLQEKAFEQREQCLQDLQAEGLATSNNHHTALRRYFKEEIDINELSDALGRGKAGVAALQSKLEAFPLIQHWSANQPDARKTFDSVVNEVKSFFSPSPDGKPHPAIALLDDALHCHQLRNKLYHDHQQTGLTIDDEKCLHALCGMFDLLEQLFPDWQTRVRTHKTVRCQIGVLRLKKAALGGQQELIQPYNEALDQLKRDHRYDIEPRSVEHSLIHTVSDRFFRVLREQFYNSIAELENRVACIKYMKRPSAKHRVEIEEKGFLLNILKQQLDQINTLLGST